MSRDYWSSENQRILGKLVDREVLMCGTDIVEYSLRNCYETEDAPFTYDDIENYYERTCAECGDRLIEIDVDEMEINSKVVYGKEDDEVFDTKEEAVNYYGEDEEILEYTKYICPFCEELHDTEEDARDCCTWNYHTKTNETVYECESCHKYYLESDTSEEPQEVYEWWFVTNWFAEKLAEHGEVVIRGWHNVWGRCCTGQAILLDGVIGKIGEEMEILEGMAHDWSKY